jgi:hypothetical protein
MVLERMTLKTMTTMTLPRSLLAAAFSVEE